MENISELIYKRFRQLNIFQIIYGKKAKLLRIVIIVLSIVALYCFVKVSNNIIRIFIPIFCLFIFFYFEKHIRGKAYTQYDHIIENFKGEGTIDRIKYIQLYLLYDYIKEKGIISADGIKYLISIYEKKVRKYQFTEAAALFAVGTGIANSIITLALTGSNEDLVIFLSRVALVKENLNVIIPILAIIIIGYLSIKYDVKGIIEFKKYLYSGTYSELLDILKNNILPYVLNNEVEQKDKKSSANKCFKRKRR